MEIFTTTGVANDDVPWGDIQKIDYSLQDPTNRTSSTGKDLIRSVTRNLLATSTEKPEQQLLIGDVQKPEVLLLRRNELERCLERHAFEHPGRDQSHRLISRRPKPASRSKSQVEILVPIVSRARTNQTDATN